jgi:hypothetical protein
LRSLVLAAALAAAAPAHAGGRPQVSPDPMTASGRLELPRAAPGSAYAGRLQIGAVKVDPAFAARAKLDAPALERALAQAAQRSLVNFGYGAEGPASPSVVVDVELLPVAVAEEAGASSLTAQLRFTAADACLARTGEGRFRVLDRQRSGGGRRAFALGSAVALAFVGVNASNLVRNELETASAQNKALNGLRAEDDTEAVAPGFDAAGAAAFGGERAIRLALADYVRRLAEPCPGVSGARVSQK